MDVIGNENILEFSASDSTPYKANKRIINKRVSIGQKLFNDKALYLSNPVSVKKLIPKCQVQVSYLYKS